MSDAGMEWGALDNISEMDHIPFFCFLRNRLKVTLFQCSVRGSPMPTFSKLGPVMKPQTLC